MTKDQIDKQRMQLGVLVHPRRLLICKALYSNKEMHSSQLHMLTGIKRPDICFHLATLHQYELLKTEFRVIEQATATKKGKAGAFYSLTDEGKQLFEFLTTTVKDELNSLKLWHPVCVNPHEKVYRGCTEKCQYFGDCEAKNVMRNTKKRKQKNTEKPSLKKLLVNVEHGW